MNARNTCITVLLMVAALVPAGCAGDPSQGYTVASQYPTDVRTVAVPIWQRGRDVYRRELEFRLTEALQKRIELDTPYKVASRAKADTLLEGTIEQVDQRVMSFNPDTSEPREKEIRLVVSFTWTDLRTGKVLATRKSFAAAATYIPGGPFDEDFFEGSEDVFDRIARRIVEQMESPWGD